MTHIATRFARSADVDITDTLSGEETVHDDFVVGHKISDLLGMEHHPQRSANTKTIKMRDRDILATDDTVLASLTGMSTTVTKMTDPHDGTHWLFIAFGYRVTSRGWRTGRGHLAPVRRWVCCRGSISSIVTAARCSRGAFLSGLHHRLRMGQPRGLLRDPRPRLRVVVRGLAQGVVAVGRWRVLLPLLTSLTVGRCDRQCPCSSGCAKPQGPFACRSRRRRFRAGRLE